MDEICSQQFFTKYKLVFKTRSNQICKYSFFSMATLLVEYSEFIKGYTLLQVVLHFHILSFAEYPFTMIELMFEFEINFWQFFTLYDQVPAI